jgi:Meiotically up-regulated gene 113
MTSKNPRKLVGIRRKRNGWQAVVHIGGRQITRAFPLDTPPMIMRRWRDDQIEMHRSTLREQQCAVRRLPCTDRQWCYIYIVRSGDRVKIGRSVDPAQRVKELQTAHGAALTLLVTVAAHADLESALHQRFAPLRLTNGEWFQLNAELTDYIVALQRGMNPVALLFEDPRAIATTAPSWLEGAGLHG